MVTSDIERTKYVDLATSAYELADAQGEFANMGTGQAIFKHHQDSTAQRCQKLESKVIAHDYHGDIAHFLARGLLKRLPTPKLMIKTIANIEEILPKICKGMLDTRMPLALEKVK